MSPGPLVDPADVPGWLSGLVAATADLDASALTRVRAPNGLPTRPASVLMLLGDGDDGPDVLLTRRADTLNSHPGQVAFPGGSADDTDQGSVDTALREAEEEAGVLADGVRPVALLPDLFVPVSGFMVTPVLALWERPSPVRVVDPAETAAVARVPIAHLAEPANRFRVRHPSGFSGPAFAAPGMLVWGFTAGLLDGLLRLADWERPWNAADVRDLDESLRAANAEVQA